MAPAQTGSIPASAPGLFVTKAGAGSNVIELLDGNGATVPGTIETDATAQVSFFKPASALVPGSYTTRVTKSCSGGAETLDTPITVTSGVALPTTAGTLWLKKAERAELQVGDSSGPCVSSADVAYVELEIVHDPSLVPYLPLLVWRTKVDGVSWSGKSPVAPSFGSARTYLQVFTHCDAQTDSAQDTGVSAGHHDVEVTAILPGGTPLAPMTIGIDLSCDPLTNGGGDGGGASSSGGSSGGSSSGSTSSGSNASAGDASQDGCTAAPHTAATSSTNIAGAFLALLALAGTARLRRRKNTLD